MSADGRADTDAHPDAAHPDAAHPDAPDPDAAHPDADPDAHADPDASSRSPRCRKIWLPVGTIPAASAVLPVTDNSTPTFSGTATPGDVVAVMALIDGGSAPVQVAQTIAAGDGSWRVATNSLSQGGYTFYVKSFNASNPYFTAQTAVMGRVFIETSGPQVSNVTYNAKQGVFDVTYIDAVGLNLGSLLSTSAYTLAQKKKTLVASATGIVGGNGTTSETISVAFANVNKKLKTGQQVFTINSGVVQNSVSVHLDGEFRGALPSGNGASGGNFQATFNVNAAHKAKGPLPVAVSVAKVTPKNLLARALSVGVSTRSVKAVHSDIFAGHKFNKAHAHKH